MIVDRLRQLKKQSNLSTQKLSELSGVPVATINRILSGTTPNPTFQTVVDLCTALGVTVDALLYPEAGKAEDFNHPAQHPLSDRMVEQYERLLEEKDQRIEDKSKALRYRARWISVLCAALFLVVAFLIFWLVVDLTTPGAGWFRA